MTFNSGWRFTVLKSYLRIAAVTVLIILSPVLYLKFTTCFTVIMYLDVIRILDAHSIVKLAALKTLANMTSALFTALVTALPCSYLLPLQRKIIFFSLVVIILSLPVWSFLTQTSFHAISIVDMVSQILFVIAATYCLAKAGIHLGAKARKH